MHTFDLNKLRGFGRKKPVLWFVFGMGLLGLAGVPLFNGYISKTLIHESIVEYIGMMPTQTVLAGTLQTVEALFTFAGGLTLAYMLKLFVAIFIEKNPGRSGKAGCKEKTYVQIDYDRINHCRCNFTDYRYASVLDARYSSKYGARIYARA